MWRLTRLFSSLLLSCSFLLFCGQGKQGEYGLPVFKQEYTREFEILGSNLELGRVSFFGFNGDFLILVGQNLRAPKYLHVVEKKTGSICFSSVVRGRGPGEELSAPWLSLFEKECFLYDRASHATYVDDFSILSSSNDGIVVGMVEDVVSGKGTRNQKFPRFPILAVFDRNGHPLIRFRNSLNIESVGFNEEEGVVYAVVRDSEDLRYLEKMRI